MNSQGLILHGARPAARRTIFATPAILIVVVALIILGALTHVATLQGVASVATVVALIAVFGSTRAASRRKSGHIEIMPSGELRLSWRPDVIDPRRTGIAFTQWVARVVHTPAGVVAVFGQFVVGAPGHDDADVPQDTPYSGDVDFYLSPEDFDRMVAHLGVRLSDPVRGVRQDAIELLPNKGSARGAFKTMAPWLITLVVISGIHGAFGADDSPMPKPVLTGVTFGLIVLGIAWTGIAYSRKPKTLDLRLHSDGIAVGGESRVSWAQVTAVHRSYVRSSRGGTSYHHVIELQVGRRKPITAGIQVPSERMAKRTFRAPRYVIGAAQGPRLVSTLERNGCFQHPGE